LETFSERKAIGVTMLKSTLGVPAAVEAVLGRDGVVTEALSRGFVNLRALARWIIASERLEATEDAVLSAIRRHQRVTWKDPYEEARGILARSHLNVRSRVAQATAPRTKPIQDKLAKLVHLVDVEKGEILYYTHGESGVKVVVDEANLSGVRDLLGRDVRQVANDLAAVSVVEPPEGLWVSGVLALMTQALALKRINAVDAVWGFPEYTFFVKQEDTLAAYEALDGLIRACRVPVADAA
jgi:hypothetical protein